MLKHFVVFVRKFLLLGLCALWAGLRVKDNLPGEGLQLTD